MGAKGRVLDVGNCHPDHSAIARMLVQHFDVEVDRVMHVDEAWRQLRERSYDLVLVNRIIFEDGSEGMPLIERMQQGESTQKVPVMLVSNYADAQARATAAGAIMGFGKSDIGDVDVIRRLSKLLPVSAR